MRTQFNARIEQSTKRRIATDRKKFSKTNDIIVEVALENFFTKYTPEERNSFYRAHDRVPYSRAA
jgi:hypothetical protein